MKKLFFTMVALVVATMSYAQSSQIATLSHEGSISTFYGNSALKEAMTAAHDGDIITLSSGAFNAINITKAVTIRGAGMQTDSITKTFPSIIQGDFTISIPDSVSNTLVLEGIYHSNIIWVSGTLKNAKFIKNRLVSLSYATSETCTMHNLSFIHCKISNGLSLPANSSASCVNCYIQYPYSLDATSSNFEFSNCVIRMVNEDKEWTNVKRKGTDLVKSSSFTNCIIYSTSVFADIYEYTSESYGNPYLHSSNVAYYCIGYGFSKVSRYTNNIFKGITSNNTNTSTSSLLSLFKSWNGGYDDFNTFELTDAAKTKYLGSDGKQVGIYGGSLPFDPLPTNPQITKCNVAAKTTADGKLSVDIQVKAAE